MFKKFSPKEDVSGSTSLKSSVQRNIRNQLLAQLPLLSVPTFREGSADTATTAPAPAAAPVLPTEEAVEEEQGKGKGGKKGGKGKGGGKKGGKEKKAAPVEEEHDEEGGEVTVLDEIWPKKDALGLTKWISIYTVQSVPLFFNHFDGPFIPTLRLLHKYPEMLPHVQIDRGAIKFLLAGANMMAPGLLSAGGVLPDGLQKDDLVAIHAEGKAHAAGIGRMAASSAEIKKAAKGVAVEVVCWVGDDLWKVHTIGL